MGEVDMSARLQGICSTKKSVDWPGLSIRLNGSSAGLHSVPISLAFGSEYFGVRTRKTKPGNRARDIS